MKPIKLDEIGLGLEEEAVEEVAEERALLERIAARLLVAAAFLLPFFFIPSVSFSIPAAKAALLYLIILAIFSLWVIARLKDGQFLIPQTLLLGLLGVLVVAAALSGVFSSSLVQSFIGQGVEVGTVVNLLLLSLLVFLVPVLLRAKDQIFGVYLAFFLSFFILALFHLLRFLFGPGFLSFGILTDAVSNTIGKWNDVGIFFGAAALLSLMTNELLSLGRKFKILTYVALVLSLFFLTVINFSEVWWVLGVFSLVFLVYRISFRGGTEQTGEELASGIPVRKCLPVAALIVVLLSITFIIWGDALGGRLGSLFKIPPQIEARPSLQATFSVARETLKTDPLFGAGPGAFVGEWLKFKPAPINSTVFWNVDFNYGVGLVPTFLVSLGVLGFLAWLLFFGAFCFAGFKAILSETEDRFSQYLVTSSFLTALFLWIFSVIYIPSQTIFALTFLFTGLFLAALVSERFVPLRLIPFIEKPKAGFVSVLLLILFLIGGLTLAYAFSRRYVSAWHFERGALAANRAGNIDEAQKQITQAASLNQSDLYYRVLAEIGLLRMNMLLSRAAPEGSADALRTEFQNLFGDALANARQAVAIRPKGYENLVELGRVYESVVPLKIEGAYENAKAAYDEALAYNPQSPAIYLTLARLEMARGGNTAAREDIASALKKKPNYTEAIFFLSQIEALEGNIKAAIASVETAAVLAPNDPTVFFQLGLLRYNDKNYRGAIEALERAVGLNPAYANAKYFLGLSYEKVGRDAEAIQQFIDLKASNPDNAEVGLILRNLKAGRAPFADAAPPIDAKPEKREKLPVPEKVKAVEE